MSSASLLLLLLLVCILVLLRGVRGSNINETIDFLCLCFSWLRDGGGGDVVGGSGGDEDDALAKGAAEDAEVDKVGSTIIAVCAEADKYCVAVVVDVVLFLLSLTNVSNLLMAPADDFFDLLFLVDDICISTLSAVSLLYSLLWRPWLISPSCCCRC